MDDLADRIRDLAIGAGMCAAFGFVLGLLVTWVF